MRVIAVAFMLTLMLSVNAYAHCELNSRYCRAVSARHTLVRYRHQEAQEARRTYSKPPAKHSLPWLPSELRKALRWHRHHLQRLRSMPTPYCHGESGNRLLGCTIVFKRHWPLYQWLELRWMWGNESNWQTHDPNSSGCDQIPQFCPADKYGCGADDAVCQIVSGIEYIDGRYQGIDNAAAFWRAHQWY